MRSKNIIYTLAVLILSFIGCYDDKGNYDYADLNEIRIEEFNYISSPTLGDTIRIVPKFTYSKGDNSNVELSYEWTFAGKVIGNERNLEWIIDTMTKAYCILRVTDHKYNVQYMQTTQLNITTPYVNNGWYILTEKNGYSSLSYIREIQDDETNIYHNRIYENLYKTVNKEEMGSGPLKLHEHFGRRTTPPAQLLVLQSGGQGDIDVNSTTFEKDINLKQAFIGGNYPVDFRPVNAMFMQWVDLLQNHDGKIYSRVKQTNELIHSGFFIQTPMKIEEHEIYGELIHSRIGDTQYCLVHEKGTSQAPQNRFLVVFDVKNTFQDVYAMGKVEVLPDPNDGWPKQYIPANNLGNHTLIHCGYIFQGNTSCQYFLVLKDNITNKYYQEQFILKRDYSSTGLTYEFPGTAYAELPQQASDGTPLKYEDCVIYNLPYKSKPFVMIAQGKDLFIYNLNNPENGVKPYYHFEDSEIACMNAENYNSNRLGIVLKNGRVIILEVNGLNLEKEKLLWEMPKGTSLGDKIINILFRIGSDFG